MDLSLSAAPTSGAIYSAASATSVISAALKSVTVFIVAKTDPFTKIWVSVGLSSFGRRLTTGISCAAPDR